MTRLKDFPGVLSYDLTSISQRDLFPLMFGSRIRYLGGAMLPHWHFGGGRVAGLGFDSVMNSGRNCEKPSAQIAVQYFSSTVACSLAMCLPAVASRR